MRIVNQAAAVGFGGSGPIVNKLACHRAARRRVLPGYPWAGKFTTKAQIDEYLGGSVIVCLLCGQAKQSLVSHVLKIHQIREEAYKAIFGLPWKRGLTSAACHKRYSEGAKARLEDPQAKEKFLASKLSWNDPGSAEKMRQRRSIQPFRFEMTAAMGRSHTVLSDDSVRTIRGRKDAPSELSEEFGVSQSQISRIRNNTRRKDAGQ